MRGIARRGRACFNNIILLMENGKDRQRLMDNVQKELMTNYYLQKYNSYMSEITKQPEPAQHFHSKPTHRETNRLNFKNMILLKKNQNQHHSPPRPLPPNQQTSLKLISPDIKLRSTGKEEQENQRVVKRLEESIINELYKPSPSKLEEGSYNKLQINSHADVTTRKFQLQPILTENIEITYEEEHNTPSNNESKEETEEQINQIKEAIKKQFESRRDNSSSPKRNSPKKNSPNKKDNSQNSSQISLEIKIQSPKMSERVLTPNRYKSKNSKNRIQSEAKQREASGKSLKQEESEQMKEQQFAQAPQVHFSREFVQPIQPHEHERIEEEHIEEEPIMEDIEFMPPSSNYYKSDNNNLVEESINYQAGHQPEQTSHHSQREQSIQNSEPNQQPQKQSLDRQSSRKSISGPKNKSQIKEPSNFEMSFVSRMSMLSSEQGHHIRDSIQKELYQNELGPYQSALYALLDLISEHPKSGPIYAVGQRTLQDRKVYEQRRLLQQKQMNDYRKKMEKLKSKSQIRNLQGEDEVIRRNKLQILRMVRRISTKL